MRRVFYFLSLICLVSCNNGPQELVQSLEKELAEAKTMIAEKVEAENYQPGLIHNVFFWLKEDLSKADEAAFLDGVRSLGTISTIHEMYIGPPSATAERGVIDNTFSYALLVHFDDLEGQNKYQVDPIHLKFIEDHKDKWVKVIVYDNDLIK